SWTTAEALRASLAEGGLKGLTLLRGGNAPGTLAPRVLVALGAVSGALLGLAVAIVHLRARRPTMSLRRAFELIGPGSVDLLEGRASWLGALRIRPWLRRRGRNEVTFARLAVREPTTFLVIPGRARHRERALRKLVDGSSQRGETRMRIDPGNRADLLPARSRSAARATLLVADARTRELDLLPEAFGRTEEGVHLLWIR